MSENMQELRLRIAKMEKQVDFIAKTIGALAKNVKPTKWMSEAEVMEALDVKATKMRLLRKNGLLLPHSSTGRKFKYLRSEVEEYLAGEKANDFVASKTQK